MKKIIAVLSLTIVSAVCIAQVKVQRLTVENLKTPLGMDIAKPRLSWQLVADKRNVAQSAYEIRVSRDAGTIAKADAWNSGKVSSDQSVHIIYQGAPLQPRQRYFWQVRVWDNSGKASPWSEIGFWETGLMNASQWKAQWIEPTPESVVNGPATMVRKKFPLAKNIKNARLYITAHGLYEAFINGQRAGDQMLTPGWTSYKKRLQYQTYDVTKMLKTGDNAVGVQLGDGWYRGDLAWENNRNIFGKDVAILCQLEIQFADGTSETITSDNTWKSSGDGPIRSSQIYHGEVYDARMEKKDWNTASFDDGAWKPVKVATADLNNIIASESPGITKHEAFEPVKIIRTPKGETVLDFGQNLVGWIQMKVTGKAGDKVTIQHAEVLDKAGNFYTANLRAAKARIEYTLKGGAEETYEPHFTFFGFRYIKVEGFPGEVSTKNFKAFALYSDMEKIGNFECSNPLVNQLQHNIQWGQRGNFLDVPTDCPQRDERLGWTGDAQAFSRAAAFNMNVEQFFAKWMKDVAADQFEDGAIPFVVPNVLGSGGASAGWADAATIVPWNTYLAYGDKTILENQYASMKKWVAYMESKSVNDLWNTGFHFGDWLFFSPGDDNDGSSAVTDKYLIAQCFFAHSTQLMINTASVLNKPDDVNYYTALLKRIKQAFLKEYLTPNGRLVSGTQTAYVLALNFDMLPEELRKQAAARLVENIKRYHDHLTTGFLGTPYLCHVLTRFGYGDVAYTLLLQETYPSWLYPVKMGATTIWERWDGIKPDSTFQTAGMNSFNHYAYGAIGDWMYRAVAGLDTEDDGPGYKHIRIKPHVDKRMTHAKATLLTPYGKAESGWKYNNGALTLDIVIPPNTTADIYIPSSAANKISESGKPVLNLEAQSENGYFLLKTGSGNYRFVVSD